MQPLWIHYYSLHLRSPAGPNRRSSRTSLEGILLLRDGGFACLQPWPELGDAPLDEQLSLLRRGRSSPLIARTFACLSADAAARRANHSLFLNLSIPKSHATVTHDADFPALAAAGFSSVKLKASPDDPSLPDKLARASAAGLSIRIDANNTGTIPAWLALAPWAHAIDFLEDPLPWDPASWSQLKQLTAFRLALDRLPDNSSATSGFDVRVLKPALDNPAAWTLRPEPVVFTSYMDHPVGQAWAAAEAARWPLPQLDAGLLTHHLFEPDAFLEAIHSNGPQLLAPPGTGLGFDLLLANLPWQRLERSSPLPSPPSHSPTDFSNPDAPGILLSNPRAPLNPAPPPNAIPHGHLAFATSGSTSSTPSIVCLSRHAFLANAAAVNAWLLASPDDLWLCPLPSFHVGGMSIHARAFLSKSPVVPMPARWNPHDFTALVSDSSATLSSLVPAQLHDLTTEGCRAPSSLRAILIGGGALPPSLAAAAANLGWPILATYGMTEASSQIATAKPAAHPCQLVLLPCWDARIAPDGRLAIRGTPLLSGFLQLSPDGSWQLSSPLDPDGWFLTNDRAKLDGRSLSFSGRADRTVKILGELVNLDAIESALALAGMPPAAGAVIASPHPRRGASLILFTEASETEARAWTAAANAALPPFAAILEIRANSLLPRSPLGKIRHSLLL